MKNVYYIFDNYINLKYIYVKVKKSNKFSSQFGYVDENDNEYKPLLIIMNQKYHFPTE